MNAHEHYSEAVRFLDMGWKASDIEVSKYMAATAQAHATLALAIVTDPSVCVEGEE